MFERNASSLRRWTTHEGETASRTSFAAENNPNVPSSELVKVRAEARTSPAISSCPVPRVAKRVRTTSSKATDSPGRTITFTAPNVIRPSDVEGRSEEHTSELQSQSKLVCRLLLEKNKLSRTATLSAT